MKNDAKSEKLMHLLCFFRMRGNKNPTVENHSGGITCLNLDYLLLERDFLAIHNVDALR